MEENVLNDIKIVLHKSFLITLTFKFSWSTSEEGKKLLQLTVCKYFPKFSKISFLK